MAIRLLLIYGIHFLAVSEEYEEDEPFVVEVCKAVTL